MKDTTEFQIKQQEKQGWGAIALVWAGSVISVPALMVGSIMGSALPIGKCAIAIVIGYLIVCSYMSFIGMQSCDSGLPTAVMAGAALGEKGAKYIISLILAVACIGWFGIQAGVCGSSFEVIFEQIFHIQLPTWVFSVFWGLVMLMSACFRFEGLKKLGRIAVPLLILVCLYTLASSLGSGGISKVQNYRPTGHITFVEAVGMTVGHFALAGAIAGDYCRFAKARADVVKSSFLGVILAGLMVLLTGAVLFLSTGEYNISVLLTSSGLPLLGLAALVLTTWTTNVANAYSGGLSLSVLLGQDEKGSRMTTAIAGILGTGLAAIGILNELRTFLSLLTAFVPPLVGPLIADYWILGRGKKKNFQIKDGFYMPGILAFFAGAFISCMTGGIFAKIPFLVFLDRPFFIGPINGIIVAAVVYMALYSFL